MTPSKRNTLILAAVSAIAAYLFYQADNFWGLVISSLIVVWALVGALPIMDGAWRTKTGFGVPTRTWMAKVAGLRSPAGEALPGAGEALPGGG